MRRFKLILTSDYEVWGNGSGCVENCVVEPTNSMLSTAEKHGAKITFFFDVCEYWAFKQIEAEKNFTGDYQPATLMKNQLQRAAKFGHDIQLHLHPQWLNYEFISNQHWKLDPRYWRLPAVGEYHNTDWNIDKLIEKGKETLEDLIRPVVPQYKVQIFRAGAWCIQPEKEILPLLMKHGIRIDSTVAPGVVLKDHLNYYDFTDSCRKEYWNTGSIVTQEGQNDLLEFPIGTVSMRPFRAMYYKMLKVRSIHKLRASGCDRRKDMRFPAAKSNNPFRFNSEYKMLNFSDGASFSELKYITKSLMHSFENSDQEMIPLVAISHPKTFGDNSALNEYLKWVKTLSNVEFGSYQEFL